MDTPKPLEALRIKIYADDAKLDEMIELAQLPNVHGFTTNPNLMRKAGVEDYETYAKETVAAIPNKPISFEVCADDEMEMERQARIIHSWGENVYVKIPVTNTKGESTAGLISKLSSEGMKLNVTLIFSPAQIDAVASALAPETPAIVSVFAGRIADVGFDPLPLMRAAKERLADRPHAELLWASCRELFNIYEAERAGSDIITVPYDMLKKTFRIGMDLDMLSLEGVKAFYEDGKAAGFNL